MVLGTSWGARCRLGLPEAGLHVTPWTNPWWGDFHEVPLLPVLIPFAAPPSSLPPKLDAGCAQHRLSGPQLHL